MISRGIDVDTAKKTVRAGGKAYPYDCLVMAPGIDIKYDSTAVGHLRRLR